MLNETVFVEHGDFEGLFGTVEEETDDRVLVRLADDIAVWVPIQEVSIWETDSTKTAYQPTWWLDRYAN